MHACQWCAHDECMHVSGVPMMNACMSVVWYYVNKHRLECKIQACYVMVAL
jgi:hypothetical protein